MPAVADAFGPGNAGDGGPGTWDGTVRGEMAIEAGNSVVGAEGSGTAAVVCNGKDSDFGVSNSCVVSGTGGILGARCVVGVGKAYSDGAASVFGLAVVVVAAVETAVDGLSIFGLAAEVLAAAETAVDSLFLLGFSSIDTNLPTFFS